MKTQTQIKAILALLIALVCAQSAHAQYLIGHGGHYKNLYFFTSNNDACVIIVTAEPVYFDEDYFQANAKAVIAEVQGVEVHFNHCEGVGQNGILLQAPNPKEVTFKDCKWTGWLNLLQNLYP